MTTTTVDISYGHTDQKEFGNLMAMTDDGRIKRILYASAAWDPADILDGNEVAVEVTVTDTGLGDHVISVAFSLDVADLVLDANVTATGIVTVVLANNTGSAVNLGAGTISVMVAVIT